MKIPKEPKKPSKPVAPTPPKKEITETISYYIYNGNRLEEFINQYNLTLDDLKKGRFESEYDDGECESFYLKIDNITIKNNKYFDKQHSKYLEQLQKFKIKEAQYIIDLEQYKEKLAIYKNEVLQYEIEEAKGKFEKAKAFLQQQGIRI